MSTPHLLVDDSVDKSLDSVSDLPAGHPERVRVRNQVVRDTLPLADRLAKRFARRGEPIDDLIQVARLGLVKSADGFRSGRGGGFAGYAIPTILGELKRHFRDKGWSVRVPRRLQEAMMAVNGASDPLSQKLGRTPTIDDLAAHLGIEPDLVRQGLECAQVYAAMSIHGPAERDGGRELLDLLGDDDPGIEAAEARVAVRPLLARLPKRERDILIMRFYQGQTQSQIAARVGLSQMHVSRLISRTLERMRGWLRENRAVAA